MAHDFFEWNNEFMNIYVGNLSYQIKDEDLRAAFEPFGEVASAAVIKDRFSGEAKGFGFVEMPRQAEAEAAIKALNGSQLKGRPLTVNMARPKKEGERGGGGGGRPNLAQAGGKDASKLAEALESVKGIVAGMVR